MQAARPRRHKLLVKKIACNDDGDYSSGRLPCSTIEPLPGSGSFNSLPSCAAKTATESGSLDSAFEEATMDRLAQSVTPLDDSQGEFTAEAGRNAQELRRHVSDQTFEATIEATMQDIEQIFPALSWDVSSWGKKVTTVGDNVASFVHDKVVTKLWDGIAQVDEIISNAALPQTDEQPLNGLPLSDQVAPTLEQDHVSADDHLTSGWGDFDTDGSDFADDGPDRADSKLHLHIQTEAETNSGLACMVQRSPLHPHTPNRRSPEHGSLDDLIRGNSDISASCSSTQDVDANGTKTCSMAKMAHEDMGNDTLAMKALAEQLQELSDENARLRCELDSRGEDDIMTQQLLKQLQAAMADKSKINKEKDQLIRENCDLRTLLDYLSSDSA